MTAPDASPHAHERAPRPWAALTGLIAALAILLGASSTVAADQPVTHFDAADAPQISVIGDSTLSAVRWYADYGPLERFNFVFSAESCRRTIEQSCISREGYRSDNVVTAIRTLGDLGEVLVVMSGYNDPVSTIDEAIETVTDEAREQGVDHVVWLSLRTSDDVDYSDPQEQSSIETFREYNQQLFEAAETSDGYLQVADWAAYSFGASGWFEGDGVHLTPTGVDAVTLFISGIVDRVLAGENVSPAAAPWTILVPGAEGDPISEVQQALIDSGVDVPGGADGVFGYDTMASVAEYQRDRGDLQVTGAVDMATARALGVYEDPDAVDTVAPSAAVTETPAAAAVAPVAEPDAVPQPLDTGDDGIPRSLLIIGVSVAALALAVVLRRRSVVARRADRRRARVHPATSPHRSVADLRRSGELPITRSGTRSHGERSVNV
ncbi:peptidoglycan-binding protein [Ilumatobacter nonamiensis]|uniref:peptidoglycan-binding protein n=1 Tax=Ilumatobacter nonamiensis TaxID=467093 RepID=UPI0003478C5E|nr:peptidoglycan-binding protein [Ilumatobacter nonamiensis]